MCIALAYFNILHFDVADIFPFTTPSSSIRLYVSFRLRMCAYDPAVPSCIPQHVHSPGELVLCVLQNGLLGRLGHGERELQLGIRAEGGGGVLSTEAKKETGKKERT